MSATSSPREFYKTWEIGKEQLFLFVFTLLAVLATDLLVGVGLGIAAKALLHLLRWVSPKELFKLAYRIEWINSATLCVHLDGAAVFSNFLSLKSELSELPKGKTLVFAVTNASFIDHTVMEFLHEFCHDYARSGGRYSFSGLELHEPASDHPRAARRRRALDRYVIRLLGAELLRQLEKELRQALENLPPQSTVVFDVSQAIIPEKLAETIERFCRDHERAGGHCEIIKTQLKA